MPRIEEDRRQPLVLLSMRMKAILVFSCFFIILGIVAYSDVPYYVDAAQSLIQGIEIPGDEDQSLTENESHSTEQENPDQFEKESSSGLEEVSGDLFLGQFNLSTIEVDGYEVNFSRGFETFIYTYPYPDNHGWWRYIQGGNYFIYYDEGQSLETYTNPFGERNFAILHPHPSPGQTFLDLYYDNDARQDFKEHLHEIVENLSRVGVNDFVLGDEWPGGLNREVISVESLSRYGQVYHEETGLWMIEDPSQEEKRALAEWFYEHSIEAWNDIAWYIRNSYPEIHLGTNIRLVWEPDYTGPDVTDWKSNNWWEEVDLGPYDFVVTHYYTQIPYSDYDEMLQNKDWTGLRELRDETSTKRLSEALHSLLDPAKNITQGRDVYLLLAAHCTYPYITTTRQMIDEWNTAIKFIDHLQAIGWFTFDTWPRGELTIIRSLYDSPAPEAGSRCIFNELIEFSKCGWSSFSWGNLNFAMEIEGTTNEWNPGESTTLTISPMEMKTCNLTIFPVGFEGNLSLNYVSVEPEISGLSLYLNDDLIWGDEFRLTYTFPGMYRILYSLGVLKPDSSLTTNLSMLLDPSKNDNSLHDYNDGMHVFLSFVLDREEWDCPRPSWGINIDVEVTPNP